MDQPQDHAEWQLPYEGGLARAYDIVMAETPYDRWVDYALELVEKYGLGNGSETAGPLRFLDLACGTGNVSLRLARRGHRVTGVDRSAAMLAEARKKAQAAGIAVEWVQQDLRQLHLERTADAALCLYDSLNYLPGEPDLAQVFSRVKSAVVPGGLFLFDLNSPRRLERVGNRAWLIQRDGLVLRWANDYLPEQRCWRMEFHGRVQQEGQVYPIEEVHYEYAHDPQEVVDLLQRAGWQHLALLDVCTHQPPAPDAGRLYFVARRGPDRA